MSCGLRRHRIVDTRGMITIKHMLNHPDDIFEMDPAEPLLTGAEPAFHPETERLGHLSQRATLARQHHAKAQQTHLGAVLSGPTCLLLPRLTQRRRKPGARLTALSKGLRLCRPVVTDGARANQFAGGLLTLTQPHHELSGEIHAARYDLPLVGTTPSSVCKPCTGEVNHGIDRLSTVRKRGHVSRVIRLAGCSPRENRQFVSGFLEHGRSGCANQTRATRHQNMHLFFPLMFRGNPRASTDVYAS